MSFHSWEKYGGVKRLCQTFSGLLWIRAGGLKHWVVWLQRPCSYLWSLLVWKLSTRAKGKWRKIGIFFRWEGIEFNKQGNSGSRLALGGYQDGYISVPTCRNLKKKNRDTWTGFSPRNSSTVYSLRATVLDISTLEAMGRVYIPSMGVAGGAGRGRASDCPGLGHGSTISYIFQRPLR